MRDTTTHDHLRRIKAASVNQYTRKDLLHWVTNETYLNGKKFSTKGHEYQERIMLDQSQEIAIIKPSQVGISEMALRMSVGLVTMIPNFSLIYTMPTATLASLYTKTRLDPIIQQSPVLKAAIRGELDSSESKQLGPNNFLYVRGSTGSNAAIAVSADMVVTDESDFSDHNVVEMTNSRLTHSPWKWKIQLSTPTTPNGPIDRAFQNSRRHYNMVKCHMCNHSFYPSYWDHVKIPGYDGSLKEINKSILSGIRYKEAALVCPKCGGHPSLQPEHREWVCENSRQKYVCAGYQVSPFDAPSIITVPYLIEVSTKYDRPSQFSNFHLGEVATDSSAGVMDEDLERIGVEGSGSVFPATVMGVDMGLTCHFMIAGVGMDQRLGIVHYERCALARFKERYYALKATYRVTVTCMDLQPYTDIAMSMADSDPNLYGATYITKTGLDLFDVRVREADDLKALGSLKQVNVNRNACFDRILADIRDKFIWVRKTEEWPIFKEHLQDMRRATKKLRDGEFTSMWQKSSRGFDHYHHALLYAFVASQLRGISVGFYGGMPGVHTFKQATAKTPEEIRQALHERYAAMSAQRR